MSGSHQEAWFTMMTIGRLPISGIGPERETRTA
jgi:hypothetical protein